jgi:pyruvate-formate lyase-activating enzyme
MKVIPKNLLEFPSMTVVSLTNLCTHECTHCQHHLYKNQPNFKKYEMKQKVFRKIIDEAAKHTEALIRLSAWGEPCLHSKIVEFTMYASKRVKTVLITNGYVLNNRLSLELMKVGLYLVEISIDAANIDTYRRVRHSNDQNAFYTVIENTKDMIKQRNHHKLKTKIVVSYVTFPNEESEKEFISFKEMWGGLADDIVKRRLHSFCGAIDPSLIKLPPNRLPCYGLWGRCNINPWGKIVICYNQWEENENVLADLNNPDVSIASIWQGTEMKILRQNQLKGIFTGPCANCNDYNPYAWEHPFEEVVGRCTKET